jgi:hypothetical protein
MMSRRCDPKIWRRFLMNGRAVCISTAHLPGKKYVKNCKNPSTSVVIKTVVAKEHFIMSCMSVLSGVQKDTYQRVEAKSMLTDDERQALLDEDSSADLKLCKSAKTRKRRRRSFRTAT